MKIVGYKEEIEKLIKTSSYDFKNVEFVTLQNGYITDEEIDNYGKFTEYEKRIIKEQYSKHPQGFFPNPHCALR